MLTCATHKLQRVGTESVGWAVDVREDAEAAGGHVTGAQRCGGDVSAQQLGDLAARWRAGCHVVLYCTRSENRAPRTAARLVERLERAAAPGSSGSSSNGVGSSSDGGGDCGARVSVLEGGFVAFVEHVFRAVQGGEMLSGVVESVRPRPRPPLLPPPSPRRGLVSFP